MANGAIQVRLHAKVRALDMLAKHLGMYNRRPEPASRGGDVRLLTDEELVEIIRKGQEAEAGDGSYDHDEPSSPVR